MLLTLWSYYIFFFITWSLNILSLKCILVSIALPWIHDLISFEIISVLLHYKILHIMLSSTNTACVLLPNPTCIVCNSKWHTTITKKKKPILQYFLDMNQLWHLNPEFRFNNFSWICKWIDDKNKWKSE